MKNRFALILAYLCVLSLFTLGAAELLFAEKEPRVSHTENRTLAGFPDITGESFFSGKFMDDLEDWLSDSFFRRDDVVGASQKMLGLFSVPGDEEPSADIGEAQLVENTGEDEPAPLPAAIQNEAVPTEQPAVLNEEPSVVSPALPADVQDADLLMIDAGGSERVMQHYAAEDISHLARVLNLYRDCLPEDGTLHYTSVPVSMVAESIISSKQYVSWESTLDDALRPLVEEGVYIYDTPELLLPYLEQGGYVYLTEDIHWSPLGASLVAGSMAEATGVPVIGYYEYFYRLQTDYHGANYERETLEALRPSRSVVQVQVPLSPVEASVLTHLTQREPCEYLLDVEQKIYDGYHLYLTGVRPPWRILETGYHTGRTALLISDCFGMAFVPYLTAYYDTVLMTDFRDEYYKPVLAGANALTYIQEYGVSDIYILTSTWTPPGSYLFNDRFEKYLTMDYPESGEGGGKGDR